MSEKLTLIDNISGTDSQFDEFAEEVEGWEIEETFVPDGFDGRRYGGFKFKIVLSRGDETKTVTISATDLGASAFINDSDD